MSGLGGRKARPQPLETGRVEMREGERAPGQSEERENFEERREKETCASVQQ